MNETGVIFLGNSGVGKSFLANLLLNRQHFLHEFAARSVTYRTNSVHYRLHDRDLRIYDIPRLIEANPDRVHSNRKEIERAFDEQKSNAIIVIYVFGHENGRVRQEDVTVFKVFHQAYPFSWGSLIIVVNGLSRHRPSSYDKDTKEVLTELTGMKVNATCFIDRLVQNDTKYTENRQRFIDAILNTKARRHSKTSDINSTNDNLDELRDELERLRFAMITEGPKYEETIETIQ